METVTQSILGMILLVAMRGCVADLPTTDESLLPPLEERVLFETDDTGSWAWDD